MYAIEYKAKNGRWAIYRFMSDKVPYLFDFKYDAICFMMDMPFLRSKRPDAHPVKVEITRSDDHIVHDVCCPCSKCQKLRKKC